MKEIDYRKNGFDILRYWAAFSVMFLHFTGWALQSINSGFAVNLMVRRIVCFFPGVVVFFTISGFLVSGSYERSVSRAVFYKKRVLRLYPELWLCTIINLIVVCFLAYDILDISIVKWVFTQILGIANTPSCLRNFATGSINGALWTIFVNVQLYIVIGILYPWLKKRRKSEWISIIICVAAINIGCSLLQTYANGVFNKILERTFLPYSIWFIIGVFCYIYRRDVLDKLQKYTIPLLLLYGVIIFSGIQFPGYYCNFLITIILPWIVIGGGYLLPKIRIELDLTYGMFLYHWIILNIIIYFNIFEKMPIIVIGLLYLGVTLTLAYFSRKSVGYLINLLKRSEKKE